MNENQTINPKIAYWHPLKEFGAQLPNIGLIRRYGGFLNTETKHYSVVIHDEILRRRKLAIN